MIRIDYTQWTSIKHLKSCGNKKKKVIRAHWVISILIPLKEDVSDFFSFICKNGGLKRNGLIVCPFEIAS